MTQGRRHLRKDIPQMLKQQIPNHLLHRISRKTSPSLNSHKAHLPVNNNHKVKHPLVLYRNLFHLNSAMTIKCFQRHGPWPENFCHKRSQLYTKETKIQFMTKNRLHLIHFVLFSHYRSKEKQATY